MPQMNAAAQTPRIAAAVKAELNIAKQMAIQLESVQAIRIEPDNTSVVRAQLLFNI
ncbi:MAG: hypothetical protein AAGG44_08625 [Planctomycetota bacterium]